ncbi:MAG: acylphosphatase [Candidatus Marinimicrobia bacterium]|nr:acylphosphatase [Candidatus Neomarinimicrobiota bacterium]
MNVSTVKITIIGQVQMVGYRWYVKQYADILGVTGYVRNASRGWVEVLAQAKEDDLDTFIDYLKKGPSRARVDRIIKEPCNENIKYQRFLIKM